MNNNTKSDRLSRRNFVFRGGKSLALLASANVGVYVIGSAFKELDGSFVAGAKCDNSHIEGDRCYVGCGGIQVQCAIWTCTGTVWFCDIQGGAHGSCGTLCL